MLLNLKLAHVLVLRPVFPNIVTTLNFKYILTFFYLYLIQKILYYSRHYVCHGYIQYSLHPNDDQLRQVASVNVYVLSCMYMSAMMLNVFLIFESDFL